MDTRQRVEIGAGALILAGLFVAWFFYYMQSHPGYTDTLLNGEETVQVQQDVAVPESLRTPDNNKPLESVDLDKLQKSINAQ